MKFQYKLKYNLFEKYERVNIKTMGFPENWKELLEIKS